MKRVRNQTMGRRGDHRARAGAVVEFAVVLPVLLTILFGIIEYWWIFIARQTLQEAAREGARLAILQTTVAPYTEVTQRVDEILAAAQLSGRNPIVMGHAVEGLSTMESVTVTIPYDEVSLLGGFFGDLSYDLVGTCSMRKEGM